MQRCKPRAVCPGCTHYCATLCAGSSGQQRTRSPRDVQCLEACTISCQPAAVRYLVHGSNCAVFPSLAGQQYLYYITVKRESCIRDSVHRNSGGSQTTSASAAVHKTYLCTNTRAPPDLFASPCAGWSIDRCSFICPVQRLWLDAGKACWLEAPCHAARTCVCITGVPQFASNVPLETVTRPHFTVQYRCDSHCTSRGYLFTKRLLHMKCHAPHVNARLQCTIHHRALQSWHQ